MGMGFEQRAAVVLAATGPAGTCSCYPYPQVPVPGLLESSQREKEDETQWKPTEEGRWACDADSSLFHFMHPTNHFPGPLGSVVAVDGRQAATRQSGRGRSPM